MMIHLYWLDKNWKCKGTAENLHLYVDYASRTYQKVINYTIGSGTGSLEVKKKDDILKYASCLQTIGFKEV